MNILPRAVRRERELGELRRLQHRRLQDGFAAPAAERTLVGCPPQTPTQLRATLRQLLEGLVYLHARGYPHGSIAPCNILVSGAKVVLVLVRAPQPARYCPPEGPAPSPAGDVWALGCVFYELASGKPLFDDEADGADRALATASPHPVLPVHLPLDAHMMLNVMLEASARRRVGAGEALDHSFLKPVRR